jgi:hypothetical protein
MKRKFVALTAAVMGLSAVLFAPAPARANGIQFCQGMYRIHLTTGYRYTLLGTAIHTDYVIKPDVGATCSGPVGVLVQPPDIVGTFDGDCLTAHGHADSWGHHADAYWVTDHMVFVPGTPGQILAGSLVFHADVTQNNTNCGTTDPGVREFIAFGFVYYL